MTTVKVHLAFSYSIVLFESLSIVKPRVRYRRRAALVKLVFLFTGSGPLAPDGHGASWDWWFNLELTNWVLLLSSRPVGRSGFKARPEVSSCPDASIISRRLRRSGVSPEVAFNARCAVSCATVMFYSLTLNCGASRIAFEDQSEATAAALA